MFCIYISACECKCIRVSFLTGKVVVLFAVGISEGHQLSQQQGVLEHPLYWLNQVRLQGGGVLLSGVSCIQELLKGLIRLS